MLSGSSSASARSSAPAIRFREEARALLQRRLAVFFGATSGALLVILVTSLAIAVLARHGAALLTAPMVRILGSYAGVIVILGAFGAVCRGRALPERALLGIDVGGLLLATAGMVVVGFQFGDPHEARATPFMTVLFLIVARASFVPSTGRRTAAASFGCTILITLGTFPLPPIPNGSMYVDIFTTSRNLALVSILATLTSRTLYGLRREVLQAQKLGEYVLDEPIGQGGMGMVFRAHHALLRRETAIKLLQPENVGEAALHRFEREVQVTARLTHPSTVAIYDYGRTPDGVFYYAMEYLDGGDLEDLTQFAGRLPAGRVIFLLEQACRALHEAHRASLIHRDVKPVNLLVCERGGEGDVTKVLDFGLVKDLDDQTSPALTGAAVLTGTPLDMSPEAITAPDTVDARSDLYALGAVAYFLLTGEPPFRGATVVEICARHLHSIPQPLSERLGRAPIGLDAVVLRCLAKVPADRFPDAGTLGDALRDCTDVAPWTSRDARVWWAANGAAMRAQRDARRAAEATPAPSKDPAGTSFEAGATMAVNLGDRAPARPS